MIFKSYHLSWGNSVPYFYYDSRGSFRILYSEMIRRDETYFEFSLLIPGWETHRWYREIKVTNGALDEMEL